MENRKIKILAIDDSRDNLIIIKALLNDSFPDITVFTAIDGRQGLELANIQDPDVILLDIIMPVMDGYEVCRRLKSNKKTSDTPVVFITAIKGDKESRILALECSAEAYLSKPIDKSELTAQVNAMLKIKEENIRKHDETERLAFLVDEKTKEMIHSHELMQYVIEHSWSAIAILDRKMDYLYVSQKYINDYKIKEKNIIGKNHYAVFPDLPRKWRNIYQKVLEGETLSSESELFEQSDGTVDWIRWESRPWYESDGSIGGVIMYAELLTEQIKMLENLKASEHSLNIAQKIAHIGSWDYDLQTKTFIWSDEVYRIFGLTPNAIKPGYDTYFKFIHPEDKENMIKGHFDSLKNKEPHSIDHKLLLDDGSVKYVHHESETIYDDAGNPLRSYGIIADITNKKIAEEKLLYLSYHDQLTGLYNRRYFEEALINLDKEENLPISIIMGDVNGLKLINDSFGHNVGDDLLKKTSGVIKLECRRTDIIARLGGDEFAVILPETDEEEAQKITNRIKDHIEKYKFVNIELPISFGNDTKVTQQQSIMDTVVNAENNMYRHKLNERYSMRSKTVDIIMKTLYEKSNREMLHSKRVSAICRSIAIKMNLNKDEIGQIEIAGLIHDVGKIGIDEKILNKSGNLNKEERAEIRKHPEMGWRILSSTNEFSELANIIIAHHENWDGSGYPKGMKEEEIPLAARIIKVADSYDAMTSGRTYQNTISSEEVIEELLKGAGTQFDARIVDIFISQVLPLGENLESDK